MRLCRLREAVLKDDNQQPARPKAAAARSGASAWLGPYASVWRKELGGDPPFGQLAKFLKPLHELYGPEKVSRAFGIYLRDLIARGEGRYASVSRFASTIKLWLPTETERWCVQHPNISMYGIHQGKSLCWECYKDRKETA